MTPALLLGAAFASLLLYAAASGSETGLYSARKIRAAIRAGKGDRFSRLLVSALLDPVPWLVTILLLQNALHYGTTLLCELAIGGLALSHPTLWNWAILTPAVIVIGDSLPKLLFRLRPEGALRLTLRPISILHRGLLPIGILLRWVGTSIPRVFGAQEPHRRRQIWSREGLEELLFEGAEAGALSHLQHGMAMRVLRISKTPVREVARPLQEFLLASEDMMRLAFQRKATARGAREAILYRGGPENPERVLRILDLVLADPQLPIRDLSKPLARLPADLPVDRAITRLQRQQARMGLVVDPSDRPLGIVTLRSLVGHVVGEVPETPA